MRTNAGQGQILYIPKIGQRADFQHPLMNDCIGWWPLTDRGGDIVTDITSYKNHGAVYGNVDFSESQRGYAPDFGVRDATNYIQVNNVSVSLSKPLTISMWVYSRTLTGNHVGATFFLGSLVNGPRLDIMGKYTASYKFYQLYSGASLLGNSEPQLNQWQHIVAVFNGVDSKIYVDGILDAQGDAGNHGAVSGFHLNSLGYNSGYPVNGKMQNIRFWSRELTDSEVLELYTNPWSGLNIPSATRYFYFPPRPLSETIGTFKMRNLSFTPKSGGRTIIRKPS